MIWWLTVGSFLLAITFMWSDRQIPGDLNSSNSRYFPLCPSWSISIVLKKFEVSTLIFCVLIRPRQHFVCFRIFAAPVVWSRLISIVQSFLKAPSSSSRHTVRPGSFFSETLVGMRTLHPCVLPLLFQSLDYFWKPLPRVISCDSAHAHRSGPFVFKTPLTAIVHL